MKLTRDWAVVDLESREQRQRRVDQMMADDALTRSTVAPFGMSLVFDAFRFNLALNIIRHNLRDLIFRSLPYQEKRS
jgi:hypothetical protein